MPARWQEAVPACFSFAAVRWEKWLKGRRPGWKQSQISTALELQERLEWKQWNNELKTEDFNPLKELVNAVLWKGILMGKGTLEDCRFLKGS